jgi:hypothetical protein
MKKDQIEFNKLAILNAMREAGIDSAEVNYEGSGDSGGVTEIEHFASGQPYDMESPIMVRVKRTYTNWDSAAESPVIQQVEEQQEIDQALENFLWDCLSIHGHGGWENNDGGRGTLELDVCKMTCRLDHSDYITESVDSSHDF